MRWLAPATSSLLFLLGCGGADQARVAKDDTVTPDPIEISPRLNICPKFETSIVLPTDIPLNASAFVAARAIDPDGDDLDIIYAWTATSGEFSNPRRAVTKYRCTEPGDQSLTVVARDVANCDAVLHLSVTCLSE